MWQGVHIIGGPTGVGKTRYGLEVARRFQTEIISADSMQVYKHFDIGTAKPRKEECGNIPYHLIDVVDPKEGDFDLARFIRLADEKINKLHERGKIPIIVGGTGLYIEALVEGIFDGPGKDEKIRQRLEESIQHNGTLVLYEQLKQVDPETAGRIHPNDRVRIIRALEVFELTGNPISELQRRSREAGSGYPHKMIVLTMKRDALYEQIEQRVEGMFSAGFIDEVKNLMDISYSESIHSMRALGYHQVAEHLEGKSSIDETKSEIKKLTRNYAKRQLTWFRHMKKAEWLDITDKHDEDVIESICFLFSEKTQ